jgi:hypothetical protein
MKLLRTKTTIYRTLYIVKVKEIACQKLDLLTLCFFNQNGAIYLCVYIYIYIYISVLYVGRRVTKCVRKLGKTSCKCSHKCSGMILNESVSQEQLLSVNSVLRQIWLEAFRLSLCVHI